MFRLSLAAALVVLSTPAFAQMVEVKGIKFGDGCTVPISKFANRLGACPVAGSKFRIWCPNGQIFDRGGEAPQSAVVRSICNLNQIQ
jgi:hypothetical protein